MISQAGLLGLMLAAAQDARDFAQAGRSEFLASKLLKAAIVYKLQVIGEAAKLLNAEFTEQHPEIAWSAFAKLRDRLVHVFYDIDYAIVWRVVEQEIPRLISHLRR